MTAEYKNKLLKADYSIVEIVELCYIHNLALKEEEYEICAKISKSIISRTLSDYEKDLVKRSLTNEDCQYLHDLNGLLECLDMSKNNP